VTVAITMPIVSRPTEAIVSTGGTVADLRALMNRIVGAISAFKT
jgi:hypothetical protein